tara:strand:+ start:822 stop:1544 length:723 start_codon:yes stop_codon:yes gene_type:complete
MATYVNLVNQALRRVNEVELDIGGDGFSDARNLQALAKDAINSSVRELLQNTQEWPFTLTTYTQTLTVGTGVYDFAPDASKVDWDTFYLKRLSSKGNSPTKLPVISYEDYIRHYRAGEDVSGESGYTVPNMAFQTEDMKFGITPLPDDVYEVEYHYWSYPADMTTYSDPCIVPDRFNTVIVDGAVMYLMRFRANEQSAALHQQKFETGMDNMRRLLLDSPLYITSTVLAGKHFNKQSGIK